jgi:hypothetical protein
MAQIEFTADQTDFSEIRSQLQSQLLNYDSWKGTIDTQTGTMISDMIASLATFANGNILRVYQDGYSETALSDRALYALAIKQGERINRKTPASITVQVEVPDTVTETLSILPFEQFSGANTYWFNRDLITLVPGTIVDVTLYQGYVTVASNMGLNTDWQSFISVEDGFSVSNDDVAVYIDGTEVPVVQTLISNYPNQAAVQDTTTGDGSLHLVFGTTQYGSRPSLSNTVIIKYAVTSGSAANNLAVLNQSIVFSTSSTDRSKVIMNVISAATGGSDETPALQYKYTGNLSYGSLDSALTKQQFIQLINSYPGVVDCLTRAQREIDPTDVQLMNVIEVYVLTESDWDPPTTLAFINSLHKKCIDPVRFVLKSASKVMSTVNATVLCKSWADLGVAKTKAEQALSNLYVMQKGIIGKDISLNDIHTALRNSYEGIDDVTLRLPTQNQIVSAQALTYPTLSFDNGGGHSGSFSYSVGAVLPDGIIAPLNWSSILVENASTITVEWDLYSNAQNYIVYGRTGLDGFGPLATLGSNVTSWTDNFTAVPTGVTPTVSSVPVKYLALDPSSSIDSIYSPRYRT